MGNLRNENLSLLEQLNLLGSKSKRSIYIDDSLLKGGFRVVNTIKERDAIDCCHRKWGMKVLVVGPLLDFKEYILKSRKCRDNVWEEAQGGGLQFVDEIQVTLVEDYSELEEDLITQRDLNLALKRAILILQSNPTSDDSKANLDASNVLGTDVVLWRDALDIYSKTQVDSKFLNGSSETAQVNSDWNAVSGPEEILNKPTIPVIVPQEKSDWDAVSGVSFIKNKPTIPAPVDLSPYALDVDLDTEKNRNDTQDLAITALQAQTQVYKTISGNVTIDDTYYNCIWKITANAIITVPSTLRADFIAGFEVIGSFAGTFTEGSGVTFSAPFGKVCTADSSGIIYKNGSATFRLKTT